MHRISFGGSGLLQQAEGLADTEHVSGVQTGHYQAAADDAGQQVGVVLSEPRNEQNCIHVSLLFRDLLLKLLGSSRAKIKLCEHDRLILKYT